MEIVLAGNPNSGKTSLFNLLTGSKQHVGNWPGVTVEKKEGKITVDGGQIALIDTPGIYTLDPDTIEQKVTRDYIFKSKPDLIINILDATNFERNLYLTLQLRESGIPMVIALNMMDEVERDGTVINTQALSQALGVPVVGISARTESGIRELYDIIGRFMRHEITIQPFCTGCKDCTKCKSGEFRYHLIESIAANCIKTQEHGEQSNISEKIDKIILNKYLAIPIFFAIMFVIFSLTFGSLVGRLSDLISYLLNGLFAPAVSSALAAIGAQQWIVMLISKGIIPGIGTVLIFLPQISVLFILMSILEDSGYMSRAAIMMDKVFSAFGLSGSSFIPMIMGFGCTVPALMSCRILPSEKNRKLTMMLTGFVSCSARLPLYTLLTGIFFKKYQGLVVFSLYLLGIVVAAVSALLLNKTVFHNDNTTFVMEMPPYRLPKLRNLLLHTWEKVKGFLVKAGTTLLVASIIVWAFQSFTPHFVLTTDPAASIWAVIGKAIAPIFYPLGFGTWQAATALITGIAAKEMLVSTLSLVSSTGGNIALLHQAMTSLFTPLAAYSFMCFALLYLPCISAIVTMRKEFNSLKWTVGTLAFDFSVAWVVAFIVFNVGRLLGL
ncbi:MAG: ferrous iron transport protein B [Clostridia bacterium]|nr:ferrous iron transport protein B [Clostridia bacterium]